MFRLRKSIVPYIPEALPAPKKRLLSVLRDTQFVLWLLGVLVLVLSALARDAPVRPEFLGGNQNQQKTACYAVGGLNS